MAYQIYYRDEMGQLVSPGETDLTSTGREDAIAEFRALSKELSKLDGWSATEFVMTDENGAEIDSVSFAA